MIPIPDEAHATEAAALLTSMFAKRRIIVGLLTAHSNRVQEIEDALWTAINGRNLSGTGWTLDILGQLVGELRQGRSDNAYQAALQLRILINRSFSVFPDVLKIIDTAAQGEPWNFLDAFPAGFRIEFGGDVDHLDALVEAMTSASPLGVGVSVVWTPSPSLLEIPSWQVPGDVYNARGPSWTDFSPVAEESYAIEVPS
jgi:hypothetical protein